MSGRTEFEQQENQTFTITVDEGSDAGIRLDKLLASHLPDLSRTRIQALLEAGHVRDHKGGIVSSPSRKVKPKEQFLLLIPPAEDSHIKPVEMPLDILFEDEHMLVINKPAGLTVHPAPGHAEDTLVNGLLAHCKESLSGIGGVARPGIVHRIDKDTSGLLVVAKHDVAHAHLADQLKKRTLKRTYQALVWGIPKYPEGSIEADIGRNPRDRKKMAVVKAGGKPAITHYETLKTFSFNRSVPGKRDTMQREDLAAHIQAELETGRTHQIRVHFTHVGHGLIGDPVYGKDTASRLKTPMGKALSEDMQAVLLGFKRQALHASKLELFHPTSYEPLSFEAPLPDDFKTVLKHLQDLK